MAGFFREQIVKRATRSNGWRKIRNNHVSKFGYCAVCGKDKSLQVHHIEDFSTSPEKELESTNLITLCQKHHILFGHLGNWKSINPTVVQDSSYFLEKIRNRR